MAEANNAEVPVIDIPNIKLWTPEDHRKNASVVHSGFRDPGFVQAFVDPAFTLEAHSIARALLSRKYEHLYAYYERDRIATRGYTPLFAETALRPGSLPDLKHFFDVPLFDVGKGIRYPGDLASRIKRLREAIKKRGMAMFRLLAIGYGLPEDTFIDLLEDSENTIIRFLHYPSLLEIAELLAGIQAGAGRFIPEPLRMAAGALLAKLVMQEPFPNDPKYLVGIKGAELIERILNLLAFAARSEQHEDMGFMTLLIALDPGLYTVLKGGVHNPIGIDGGRITFNAGDMATLWSQYHHPEDPMQSTTHGVTNSPDINAERFGVATFFLLRRDVKLNDEHTSGSFHDMRTKRTITAA